VRIVDLSASLVERRKGVRESPVVPLTVSVPAAGFVEGGVLLSSLLKESSFAPAAVGIVAGLEVFIFVFLVWCDEFGRSR
jgi:hypothetical protein